MRTQRARIGTEEPVQVGCGSGKGEVVADRYCTNCGHELRENERFCPNCGRPVHQTAHVPTPEADVPVPPPPHQQAEGSAPRPPQAEAPTQEGQRPTAGQPSGGRRRLLIGLGALGAVIVVGLVAALLYSTQGENVNTIIENQRRLAANDPDNHVEIGSGYVPQDSPGEAEAVRSAITFFDAWEQGDYEYVYNSWGSFRDAMSLEKFKQEMEAADYEQFDWRIENVEPYAQDQFLISGTVQSEGESLDWQTQFIDSDGDGVYTVGPRLARYF
jgi:zinc-ribbon domain